MQLFLSIFTDFCSYWWLAWSLPFVLGLILGWLFWGRSGKKIRLLEDELGKIKYKQKSKL